MSNNAVDGQAQRLLPEVVNVEASNVEGDKFFGVSKDQSKVKSSIVAKYFPAWAKIMAARVEKIGYIDLWCGPGAYEDGTESTPIKILKTAVANPTIQSKIVTTFNDKNKKHVKALSEQVAKIEGIGNLKFRPQFIDKEIKFNIADTFEKLKMVPTLVFLDPYGYKGLSVRLLGAMFKDWGCDAIFFFNYNRVNMGVNNRFMTNNIDNLFGPKWAPILRQRLKTVNNPDHRERIIIEILKAAINELGGTYFLPFRFLIGKKTSHYLIFISKNVLGYDIMKQMMAAESIVDEDGIPSFEFNSLPELPKLSLQLTLFDEPKKKSGLQVLADLLLVEFKGRDITVAELISTHNVNKNYIGKNYKDALRRMEERGIIRCEPSADKRQKREGVVTMGDKVRIFFPS